MADNPQYRIVNGPNGPINFPSGMSDDQVTQAMRRLYPPKQASQPQAPPPQSQAPPFSSWQAILGKMVPEAATQPLQWLQQHYVAPMESYVGKAGAVGRELGRESFGMGSDPNVQQKFGMANSPTLHAGLGAASAIGGVAAQTVADPRNWPLMASSEARPLLQRLMSGGFGVQMGAGAVDAAKQLHNNWDKLTIEQRSELITQMGLSTVMASMSAYHAGRGVDTPLVRTREEQARSPEVVQPTPTPIKEPLRQAIQAQKPVTEDVVEQTRRGAAPEVSAPLPNMVPEGQRASDLIIRQQAEALRAKMESRGAAKQELETGSRTPSGAEVTTPPRADKLREIEKIKSQLRDMEAQQKQPYGTENKPLEVSERIFQAGRKMQADGLSDAEISYQLMKSFPERAEDIAKAYGQRPMAPSPERPTPPEFLQGLDRKQAEMRVRQAKEKANAVPEKAARPEVGGAPEAMAKPPQSQEPVQAPGETARSGEPVRGTEGSALEEKLKETAKPERDTAILDAVKKEHPDWSLSQQLQEAAKRANPPSAPKGVQATGQLDFKQRLDLQKQLVERMKQDPKFKGISTSRLQEMASEAINKQRGGIGGSEPEDIRARREAKINSWIEQLRDPKADPKTIDMAFNMLKAYGLEHDEIIRRVAGSEGFAETPDEQAAKERTQLSLADQMAKTRADIEALKAKAQTDPKSLSDLVERVAEIYHEPKEGRSVQDIIRDTEATVEGRAVGAPDIKGIKSPEVEFLDKLYNTKDPFQKQIQSYFKKLSSSFGDEKGVLSFRKIPRQQFAPLTRLADVLDGFSSLGGALERSAEEELARNVTRKYSAELRLKHLQLNERLKDSIEAHDTDGKAEFRAFMDAGEGKPGAQFLKPEDQALANELHQMFQERWDKVQKYLDLEPGGIENYLSHLWERRGRTVSILQRFFGKRPVAGQGGFLRQRFYDYASEGLDKGLKPITWNPIKMQLTALYQMDKFLAGHELKDTYADAGLVKWHKLGERAPEGWTTLNDRIFQPKAMGEGFLKEYGRYYAPPDVAKIFNRYVDPGLRGDVTYDAIRAYGNTLNQINLGASGYHGVFITLVSSAADVARGIEKVANNHDVGGFGNILRGTLGTFFARSAVSDYKLGRSIQTEALRPTGDPLLSTYVRKLTEMGASFDQDPMYENSMRKVWTSLKSGHPVEALQGAIQNFPVTKFIMKSYVPRIKLGMAAHMMNTKIDYLFKQGVTDPVVLQTELGKVWDSVDNRAGQMVYDNLFWNKTAKDLSFLAVRAVGWDLGSAREFGGGIWRDPLHQAAQFLRGDKSPLSSRTAFVAGTVLTMGTLGATITYLVTGKPPQTMDDYFYPPSGRMGSNGKPERISFPNYLKDMYSISHDAASIARGTPNQGLSTLTHKLHPEISQVIDMLMNRDFYNTEIREEGAPMFKQAYQLGKYYVGTFTPFSASLGYNRWKQGVPGVEAFGESMVGIQRAPSYVTSSKAEELALDFAKRTWSAGPTTHEERERRDTFNLFRSQMSAGKKLDMKALQGALREGKLQPNDVSRLYSSYGKTPLEADFQSISLKDAFKVMQVATPDERHSLTPLLMEKYGAQLYKYPPDEQQGYYHQLRQYLQK